MGTRDSRVDAVTIAAMVLGLSVMAVRGYQEPTYRAGNRTVAVYATVTGPDGRLVPNLTKDAFAIDDNGKPQEITLFANTIQPITAVVLLDRSGSMRANFRLVELAAARFVGALQAGDKARIGSFSNRIQLDPRDFTSDHGELLTILKSELQPEGPTPLWNAIYVGITALLRQQGRRVILVFTDGMDSPQGAATNSLKTVMKYAEEEDVMIYAIGLAPAGSGGGSGRSRQRLPGRAGGGFGGPGRPGGFARIDRPDEGLSKIAAATGGGYFELTSANDLAETFAKVADELHHQYALGFTPTTLDGKVHSLELHVRGEGMSARARKSYLARGIR
jgi:Ca-activated chloride channel family protein